MSELSTASTCRSHHATVRCSSGHGRTQPAAHRAGGHGGVVRPVARPVGRVEGPDVVCPRTYPSETQASTSRTQSHVAGSRTRPRRKRYFQCVPWNRMSLNVKVVCVDPFLEDPLISMGWKTPLARRSPSLSRQTPPAWRACMSGVWCVVRVVRAVCGVWCVVCHGGICGVRSTQKGTRKQHAKDPRKKHTQKAQSDLRKGGKMSRRASHAANLRHVDDERIRRDVYVSAHFHLPLIHGDHMYISQQSPKSAPRLKTRSSHAFIALKSKVCTAYEHTVITSIYHNNVQSLYRTLTQCHHMHTSQRSPKYAPRTPRNTMFRAAALLFKTC